MASSVSAQAPLGERLDALLDARVSEGFSGVVRVGQGDSTLYARAVGLADRGWGIPNAPDTRFPWASVTKQVVAVAMLQLIGEGRLSLETPLAEVLPGLGPDAAGRVTVRSLLNNASGLPDMESLPSVYVAPDSTVAALVDGALREDLAFEPGSTFRYNNLDFIVLGPVLEALDGRLLADILRACVFEPAGMSETVLLGDARVEPRLAAPVLRLADGARSRRRRFAWRRSGPPPPSPARRRTCSGSIRPCSVGGCFHRPCSTRSPRPTRRSASSRSACGRTASAECGPSSGRGKSGATAR